MVQLLPDFAYIFLSSTYTLEPRPGLHPIPGTQPLTLEAAICPPLLYYVALLFLAPPPPQELRSIALTLLRNALALLAAFVFFRLPLAYHVPQSIGLTYQLGLIGLYGGAGVLDRFFICPYLLGHIPRRVRYHHVSRPETPNETKALTDGGAPMQKGLHVEGADTGTKVTNALPQAVSQSDLAENMNNDTYSQILSNMFKGPTPKPVFETATTEDGWPHSFADRASWAFELELSMRGVGFTWTTADVRHTKKTWLPTVGNRVHSLLMHTGPVLVVGLVVIRYVYVNYFQALEENGPNGLHDYEGSPFDDILPFWLQILLTAAMGAFLMAAFSFGHSLAAIAMSSLAPSPLAFFPTLYTTPVWKIQSVRGFWSHGWHRLFARLFLVWGVWPGQWLERKLTGKSKDQPADIGKVLGGFLSSAFVHSFSVRGVLGGRWADAKNEAAFFALNGVAVIVEEVIKRAVLKYRKENKMPAEMWYDAWIGRVWWIGVLLMTGRNFARGWTKSSLIREMAFM